MKYPAHAAPASRISTRGNLGQRPVIPAGGAGIGDLALFGQQAAGKGKRCGHLRIGGGGAAVGKEFIGIDAQFLPPEGMGGNAIDAAIFLRDEQRDLFAQTLGRHTLYKFSPEREGDLASSSRSAVGEAAGSRRSAPLRYRRFSAL